jgi:hypothetical protein
LDNKLAIIQNQLIRQASGDTFNPTRELFSYEDANKRSKKLAKNIIQTFRHAYNIEGVPKKDIKEKDE